MIHTGWASCEDFLPFPGGSALVSTGIAEVILILRTYALFQRSRYILTILSALWCGQMIAMGLVLRNAAPAPLPPGFVGCVMGPQGPLGAAFWLSSLVVDTIITILTVFKATQYIQANGKRDRLVHVILRDGLMYFVVILTANLSNCLTYYLAPIRLRVIIASFCQGITSVMVSRLQLNLRSDSITLSEISISQNPGALSSSTETRTHEKQLDSTRSSTTLSSILHFFQSTVTEMERDVAMIEEEGNRMTATGAESDIEMGPINPASGIVPAVPAVSSFTPEKTNGSRK
ncbi:hypothetical protein FRC12_020869 [Ceratobasidium sp. 428]|nr:hypothetical protein FRC12_020869 [Ceratobasidium sp. 428]